MLCIHYYVNEWSCFVPVKLVQIEVNVTKLTYVAHMQAGMSVSV